MARLARLAEPRIAWVLIACLAFLAYVPVLSGGFVYDDERFIERNPPVTHLTAANVVRYFTDPTSQSVVGHDIYRPLRTLEFAIDWAVSGGRPWFFHLRSVLWHALACVLLYAVLRRLLESDVPALLGALAFALHPVHTESVAWITSRSDVLLLFWFLLALLLYLRERPLLAALAFLGALLSKETAVFFPAAVFLVDLFRRADLQPLRRWIWYGVYAMTAFAYVVFWVAIVAGGRPENVGHLGGEWWGGSYGMTVLTMTKGFLHYARVIAFPVHFTIDYHVPVSTGVGAGEIVAILILAAIVAAAIRGGPRSRLALAWFFLALLPVSNLIRPIGIPTAERFLYLPLVGVALWAGPVLARHRRLAAAVLACLFVLTFARSRIWRSNDSLWLAAEKVAPGPRALDHLAGRELRAAHDARDLLKTAAPAERAALQERMRRHARETVRYVDEIFVLHANVLRLPPTDMEYRNLPRKANALVMLGRPREALVVAKKAIRNRGGSLAYFNAALALQELGIWEEAARHLQTAHDKEYPGGDLRPTICNLWLRAAADRERAGDASGALEHYRRAWRAFPDPEKNAPTLEAIRRLGG
ncbi:MAG: tetratricopeptide repeat protein [Planctomycetota bacterium]|jgi:tetratricopeptide (TPR) repeat protein